MLWELSACLERSWPDHTTSTFPPTTGGRRAGSNGRGRSGVAARCRTSPNRQASPATSSHARAPPVAPESTPLPEAPRILRHRSAKTVAEVPLRGTPYSRCGLTSRPVRDRHGCARSPARECAAATAGRVVSRHPLPAAGSRTGLELSRHREYGKRQSGCGVARRQASASGFCVLDCAAWLEAPCRRERVHAS